jgi:hypothetical protein
MDATPPRREAGAGKTILAVSFNETGMGVARNYRGFSSVDGPPAGFFTPDFITARLQPQMEKYRCLWCKSSSNHNILYFQCTPW